MRRVTFVVLSAACMIALAGCARGRPRSLPPPAIRWGSPRPISERITGERYMLPDGWKAAVAGVDRIRVSNFGALAHDPATVANVRRFQELTGLQVELLAWPEDTVLERTLTVLAAESDAVDVLCYDHTSAYRLLVAGGWLQALDSMWNDPNVWLAYPASLQAGLTAADGRIYGSIGQVRTELLFYRPSMVSKPPETWQEVRQAARRATRSGVWGFAFGGADVLHPFRAMVYAQGARLVDTERQRLVVDSQAGRNAWRLLVEFVLADGSTPPSLAQATWIEAADAFALGKAAMAFSHTSDLARYQDPQRAPGLRAGWAASPSPRWASEGGGSPGGSYLDLDGYAVNRFSSAGRRAAAMLFLDYMRSAEAAATELLDEGNEAAVLEVYDAAGAKNLVALASRKEAMATAVLEPLPPAAPRLAEAMAEAFARVIGRGMDPTRALEALQARLDEYAVPSR